MSVARWTNEDLVCCSTTAFNYQNSWVRSPHLEAATLNQAFEVASRRYFWLSYSCAWFIDFIQIFMLVLSWNSLIFRLVLAISTFIDYFHKTGAHGTCMHYNFEGYRLVETFQSLSLTNVLVCFKSEIMLMTVWYIWVASINVSYMLCVIDWLLWLTHFYHLFLLLCLGDYIIVQKFAFFVAEFLKLKLFCFLGTFQISYRRLPLYFPSGLQISLENLCFCLFAVMFCT